MGVFFHPLCVAETLFSALLPVGAPTQWAKPHTLAVAKGRPNHDPGAGFGHVLFKSGQVVRVDHPLASAQ